MVRYPDLPSGNQTWCAGNRTIEISDFPILKLHSARGFSSHLWWNLRVSLVGGFNPSEKYESPLGWLFPTEWENNPVMFQSPPTRSLFRPLLSDFTLFWGNCYTNTYDGHFLGLSTWHDHHDPSSQAFPAPVVQNGSKKFHRRWVTFAILLLLSQKIVRHEGGNGSVEDMARQNLVFSTPLANIEPPHKNVGVPLESLDSLDAERLNMLKPTNSCHLGTLEPGFLWRPCTEKPPTAVAFHCAGGMTTRDLQGWIPTSLKQALRTGNFSAQNGKRCQNHIQNHIQNPSIQKKWWDTSKRTQAAQAFLRFPEWHDYQWLSPSLHPSQ